MREGKYERCNDDEQMSPEHCPDRQQKLVHDKLNKLELIIKEGHRSKKCVCKFLKCLGLVILALSAVAIFIRLGVVDGRHRRGRHHRGRHHGGRHHQGDYTDEDF